MTTLPPDEHRILRDQLGVYVLGQSSPAEQEVLRAHLDGCALCRNDVAQLAPVAARLSGLNPTDLQALPAPPKQLRDKVLSQIADEEERDRLVHLDMPALGLDWHDSFVATDEITGEEWSWSQNAYVRLDPGHEPAHVISVRRPR